MKSMMNLSIARTAVLLGAFVTLTISVPASAQCVQGANSSLNLKTFGCESTIDQPVLGGGMLTATGHLRVANSGKGPATVSSVVAKLQVRIGNDWQTVANAVVTACGSIARTCSGNIETTPGAVLSAPVPATAGRFAGVACSPANTADIPYSVSFPAIGVGYQLTSGKPARIEFVATYDGAATGCPNNACISGSCGFNRDVVVRFGFPIP